MKSIAIITIVSVLLCGRGAAQQPLQGRAYQDSLLKRLPTIAEDTAAVKLLTDLSFSYGYSNTTDGFRYARRALALSRKIGWKKGEALALNELGNCYRYKADYAAALDHHFKALRIHEEQADRGRCGVVLTNIGTVYYASGDYGKALPYYAKALECARAVRDTLREVIIQGHLGNMAYEQKQYDRALEYMHSALAGSEKLGDVRGVIVQLTNIGNIHGEKGNHREALDWYFKTLRMAEQEGDSQIIVANEGNIGITYLDLLRDTVAPLPAAQRRAYLENAIAYLTRSVANARRIKFVEAELEVLPALSEAHSLGGDYRAGLEAYRQYAALKDSTFNLQNNKLIADLETARAVELKDKDIQIAKLAVAKKRNERYAYIGGIALLLAILGIVFRNYRRQQRSNTLLSREKNRSDDLLRNILPAEVAEELKETGTAHPKQYDTVSVLFTDFVNFTSTAEALTPKAVVEELNECFTAFDAIIERTGLERIKTIGDAYMAVSGVPSPNPRHAVATVEAAIAILQFVQERRRRGKGFDIRIGIHSGPVVAGIVGVKKFAYDIWGDTVNTAARMEQHGIVGAVNISKTTYEQVKADFDCTYRGKIAAKHKGEVEMYLVQPLHPPAA